jgi:lysozyme
MAAMAEDYLLGIDVSHHQGDVDHLQVAQSGMLFCVVKATEGRDYEDPKFASNIARIREVLEQGYEYYPGAYHFARPDSDGGNAEDGRAEAEDFCDAVERVCGSILGNFMPPALDFEKYSESDANENIPWIEAWIEVVERRLGRSPMIYTGANVWRYEVGNTDRFIDYPLWQVYYSGVASQPPQMPWPSWTMWQYSGGGSYQHHPDVPGVGVVDVNRWYGSLEDLRRFAHAPTAPPPSASWPSPPPQVDLEGFRGSYSAYVARVQGLLLSHDYGPSGLVGGDGRPDGLMGDRTANALVDFKRSHALDPNTVMDWSTWWALSYDQLV